MGEVPGAASQTPPKHQENPHLQEQKCKTAGSGQEQRGEACGPSQRDRPVPDRGLLGLMLVTTPGKQNDSISGAGGRGDSLPWRPSGSQRQTVTLQTIQEKTCLPLCQWQLICLQIPGNMGPRTLLCGSALAPLERAQERFCWVAATCPREWLAFGALPIAPGSLWLVKGRARLLLL